MGKVIKQIGWYDLSRIKGIRSKYIIQRQNGKEGHVYKWNEDSEDQGKNAISKKLAK